MHPQIRRDKPGDCPICGMKLTPLRSASSENSHEDHAAHTTAEAPASVQLMEAQNKLGNLQTETVTPKILTREIGLSGDIEYISDNHLDLTTFYPGRVERVLIPYNTTEVDAGTPLLELYSEEAITDQEKYLQALRERYLTTFQERKIVQAQIETIRARLTTAGFTQSDLDNLLNKGEVKRTVIIRARHGGSLVGKIPHTGERLNQEMVLFHIAPLEKVWFVAKVFEQDLSTLKLGQPVEVQTKANPGKTYPGTLVFVDRTVDATTRTILARFEVNNHRRELLPNLSATGTVRITSAGPVLVVPESAVIDTGKRQLVYVKTSPTGYEPRDVTVGTRGQVEGLSGKTFVEITSGLKNEEPIVTSGTYLLDAEAQLRGTTHEK
jgi:Cu(I)/Ag(I) efflux system membrane fusion protein